MKNRILYLQYTNPANYPPLEHSGLILSNAGWDVWFFGIQSEGESNKLIFPEPLARRQTLWKQQSPGIRQKLQYFAFTLAALWRALWQRPTWVYCSDLMSCPAAWLILKVTRCRVLYHEHDSPEAGKTKAEMLPSEVANQPNEVVSPLEYGTDSTGQPCEVISQELHRPGGDFTGRGLHGPGKPEMLKKQSGERKADDGRQTTEDGRQDQRTEDRSQRADGETTPGDRLPTSLRAVVSEPEADLRSPTSGFQRFLMWIRKRVGQNADLVVLPNQKRLELFLQCTGRQRTSLCVYNCPRKDEVMPQKVETRSQGTLRLAFHGSINRDRLPLAVLEAMSRFPGRVQLSVVGYETVGSKGYMREFLQTAKLLGLSKAVEFVGALPRCKIFQPASKCNVGLAFMPLHGGDVNMANMTGASNKPYDYLACGLALLVSARPEWETMFVRPGYGLACNPDDADSIATQLRWFLEHPLETREMGERGQKQILEEWNYEKQFGETLKVINQVDRLNINNR